MADDSALTVRPGRMQRAWRSLTGRDRLDAAERELAEERRRRHEAQDREEATRSRMAAMIEAGSYGVHVDGRTYIPGVSPDDLDVPVSARPVQVQCSTSRMPGMRRTMIARARPLPTTPGREMQGGYGTPWLGMVPGVEYRPDLHPYSARGLGTSIGLLERVAQHGVASDTIQAVVDVLAGGSVYVRPPEVSESRARYINGYDPDRLSKISEWVNVQLQLNPAFNFGAMLRELLRCHEVAGFSLHEFTIDPAAEQWVLSGVEYRAAGSVMEWIYSAAERRTVAFTQSLGSGPRGSEGDGMPTVDLARCVHVVNRRVGLNPEGIATTRQMYQWTHGAGVIWETIMQHRARFGVGFPVFRLTNDAVQDVRTQESIAAARKFYASPTAYMQLPVGLDVEMLSIEPDTAGVEILRYCDMMIRRSAGMQHLELGIEGGGSYSLGQVSTQFFLKRMAARISAVSDGMQQLIRSLVDARFGPQVLYPELAIDGILTMSASEILGLWRGMTEIEATGALTLDERNRMRRDAGLPPVDDVAQDAEIVETSDVLDERDPADVAPETRAAGGCCGADHSARARARSRVTDVVVIGRDGMPFMTHRALTQHESAVAWRSIADGIEAGQQRSAMGIAEILTSMRGALLDAIVDAVADGDLGAVAEIAERFNARQTRRYVDELGSRLSEQLTAWADVMEADMLDELAALGGEIEEQPDDTDIDAFVRAIASTKARQVVNEFVQTLTAAAIRGGQARDPEIIADIPISMHSISLGMREAYTTVMSQARESTAMRFGPEIVGVQISAVMDDDTCGQVEDGSLQCAATDEVVMLLTDPLWGEIRPPNRNCLSALNLRRGNLCRCLALFLSRAAYEAAIAGGE